jgi:hypothetical protein
VKPHFDRERLAAVLASAKIDATKKNIMELDLRLTIRQLVYWIGQKQIIGTTGPSKELLDLHDALRRWLATCFRDLRNHDPNPSTYELEVVIDEYCDEAQHDANFEKILWFFSSITETIELLEADKPHRSRHPKAKETYLFLRLYDDYRYLSGKQTLSPAGPQIRFITECTKIIDQKIIVPARLERRIEEAIARRA